MRLNSILEGLYGCRFSRRQLVVILALLRQSVGYQREEAPVGSRRIAELTGIQANHVATTLSELLTMAVIRRPARGVYAVNPADQWQIDRSAGIGKDATRPALKRPHVCDTTAPAQRSARTEPEQQNEEPRQGCGHSKPFASQQAPTTNDLFASPTNLAGPNDPDVSSGVPSCSPQKAAAHRRKKKEQSDGAKVWDAYANAYGQQYGVPPVRNAKTNALCATLARRLGVDEAQAMASWFLTQGGFYSKRFHPLDLLVKDAESLRMLWITRRPVDPRGLPDDQEIAEILLSRGIQPGQLSPGNERTLALTLKEEAQRQAHQSEPDADKQSHARWLVS